MKFSALPPKTIFSGNEETLLVEGASSRGTLAALKSWMLQGIQTVVSWSDITGKPNTFPPDAHAHAQAEITDLLTTIAALQSRLSAVESAPPSSGVPSGIIAAWWASTPPSGWVLADGHATTNEPTLAAIYGANVPNFAGKVLMGAGGVYTLNSTGGEATHTLTRVELPTDTPAHPLSFGMGIIGGTYGQYSGGTDTWGLTNNKLTAGGQPHNNQPPYTTVTWIIKL